LTVVTELLDDVLRTYTGTPSTTVPTPLSVNTDREMVLVSARVIFTSVLKPRPQTDHCRPFDWSVVHLR